MDITIDIKKIDGHYQASCPQLKIHSFGLSQAKALIRLKMVLRFYLETAREMGYKYEIENSDWDKALKNINPDNLKNDYNKENSSHADNDIIYFEQEQKISGLN